MVSKFCRACDDSELVADHRVVFRNRLETVTGGTPSYDGQAVSALLTFFGVASISAWQVKYGKANVAYRHSPSFESDESALATWLRLAELDAERQRCADYRESGFKQVPDKCGD